MRLVRLSLLPCLLLTAALSASASSVTGQITFSTYAGPSGNPTIPTATGLNFGIGNPPSGLVPGGGIYSFGNGTGSLANMGACSSSGGDCGSITDLHSFTTGPISDFLVLPDGASFDLLSISSLVRDTNPAGLSLIAFGTLNWDGYSATPAELDLTAVGSAEALVTGTLTAEAVTPEPSTLALLSGPFALLAGIGTSRLRRRA